MQTCVSSFSAKPDAVSTAFTVPSFLPTHKRFSYYNRSSIQLNRLCGG